MDVVDLVAEENVPIAAEEFENGMEENDDGDEMIANCRDNDFLIIPRHVLPHLPAMDLLRFRSVSPDWNRFISGPFFVLTQSLQPRSVSGLFFHDNNNNSPNYYPFDPHHHSIPDPTLSFLPEPVVVKSSTRGLLCCRGHDSSNYYVANPTTAAWTALPRSTRHHPDGSTVAVVFDEPSVYNFDADYRVAVAFPISDGYYCFESFSSATWAWGVGAEVCAAEEVVGGSGVAAGGWAYWRTTMGPVLGYQPASDTWRFLDVLPPGVDGNPWWELGEMEGRLAVTCARESMVEVHVLEDGAGDWRRAGGFRAEETRPVLRSQGKAEVLTWQDTRVVVRDLNGRELREVGCDDAALACAGGLLPPEFIPYVSTLVDVRRRD